MAKKSKEQTQIIMLVAVLAVIGGVLIYSYRSAFVPVPSGDLGPFTIPVRPTLPGRIDVSIFGRKDFPSGAVPTTVPVPSTQGVDNPFVTR